MLLTSILLSIQETRKEGVFVPIKKSDSLFKTTLAVTLLIFVSKAGGFIREIIMAAYYGTGAAMDAYNSAYSLYYVPVLLFNSCITSTLIPVYVRLREDRGLKPANHFASNVLSLFGLAAMAVSILMFALAGPIVRLTNGGYTPEKQQMTAQLLRIMLPSLVFLVSSIVLSSILNAREKYLSAQLTGFPITVALITATIGFSGRFGIQALAWGVFFSGILQVLILLPSLRSVFSYRLRFKPKDEDFKHLLLLACPAVLSMAVNELNHLIDRFLATGLSDGVVSGMNFAYKLITFLQGVLLVPLTTIMFSKMSQHAAKGDNKAIINMVMRCIEVIALVILPITAVCVVMGRDVISAAYMRGQFNAESVGITVGPFVFYVIGLVGFGLRDMLNRAFHSLQDTKTPMANSTVTVVLNVVLNLLLVRVMGASGLALATSISGLVGTMMLFARLREKLGRMGGRKTLIELMKIAVCTALCALACIAMDRLLPGASSSLMAFVRLGVSAAVALIVYGCAAVAVRVNQVRELTDVALAKLKRR